MALDNKQMLYLSQEESIRANKSTQHFEYVYTTKKVSLLPSKHSIHNLCCEEEEGQRSKRAVGHWKTT